jgi:tyrosyl-tRNA synthetase
LYDRTGCTAQLGGSDQWGNITAGIDLIRRVRGARVFGAVFPLIVSSSGTKFGKTEAGTIWLDPARTSPYRFYQYWVNTDDTDAKRYLRFFTLLDRPRIEEIEAEQAARPHERPAQKALAEDVTRRVHGETGLARALAATSVLFGGSIGGLGADEIADVFADVPSAEIARASLEGDGTGIVEVLAETGVTASKGEARRAVEGGGVYLNNQRVSGVERAVSLDDAVEGRFVVLRLGKKRYHLLRVVG